MCRHDLAIALLQSTIPWAAPCSGRVCCVPTATDDVEGEQRLLSWKKSGMGTNEGEETCSGVARPGIRGRDREEKQVAFVCHL